MKHLPIAIRWISTLMASAIMLSGVAAADTIDATGVDSSRGEYNIWINAKGADMDTYFAGVILIQLVSPSGTFNRDTMCVDLFTDIYINQVYGTNVKSPDQMGGGELDRVSWLLDNALMPGQNGGTTPSALPTADWATTAPQGAGLQLAIWDIVQDNGDGFSAGTVQQGSSAHSTDANVLAWANYYESQSVGKSSADAYVYLNVSLSNGSPAQTLEGPQFVADGGPQPTPEAPTLILVGTILGALSMVRRRKQHA